MPPTAYADIAIDLDPLDDNTFLVKVRAPDGAESRSVFTPPAGDSFVDLLARFERDDLDAAGAATLGMTLFDALLSVRARDMLQRGLSYAEQRGLRPRLLLSIPRAAHVAAALPWELLHDSDSIPLLRRGLTVVRHIPLDRATPPPLTASRLRVLLTAAPADPPASVERELVEVQAALETVADRTEIVVEPRLTPTILQRRLREGFHAWHHVGHGRNDGSLILLDDGGDPVPLMPAQLGGIMAGGAVRLAAFSACDSGRFDVNGGLIAVLSDAGVPTIIAMQRVVAAEVTRVFAGELYRALAEGWSTTAAVDEGRRAVLNLSDVHPDWAIPVIYSRVPDEALFILPEPPEQLDRQRLARPLLRNVFDQLLGEQVQLFAGRDQELAQIARFTGDPDGGYLLIAARAGFGKTTLMARAIQLNPEAFAYHFFAPLFSDSLSELFFLRNVAEQMALWYNDTPPLPTDLASLRSRYLDFLEKPPDQNRTLILDGLDEVTEWNLAFYLARRLPPRLHLVLTVRDVGQDPVIRYRLPSDQTTTILLGGLSRAEVADVLRVAGPRAARFADDPALLNQIMRVAESDVEDLHEGEQHVIGSSIQNGIIQKDAEPSHADPFYVRFLAEDAAAGLLTAEQIGQQPAGVTRYLDAWWQEVKRLAGDDSARDLFGTLTVASGRLHRDDLLRINPGLASGWTTDIFDDVLAKVHRMVYGNEQNGYALIHPRLRQYMGTRVNTRVYRDRLLRFCADWLDHRSQYVPHHYAELLPSAGSYTASLLALLDDYDFLEAIALQAGIQDPLESLQVAATFARQAGDVHTIETLCDILAYEVHNLEGWNRQHYPAYFAQQIYNRARMLDLEHHVRAASARLDRLGHSYLTIAWRDWGVLAESKRRPHPHIVPLRAFAVTPLGGWPIAISMDVLIPQDAADIQIQVNLHNRGQETTLALQGVVNLPAVAWEVTVMDPEISGPEAKRMSVQQNVSRVAERGVVIGADIRLLMIRSEEDFIHDWRQFVTQTRVTLTPDAKHAVVGARDGTLTLWNVSEGRQEQTLGYHSAPLSALVVTPDGRRLVTASVNGSLKSWNLVTGQEEYLLTGHQSGISCVAMTPDSRGILSASSDATLRLWDLERGTEIYALRGHSAPILAIALAATGIRAVSGAQDGRLIVWNLATGEAEHSLQGHTDAILSLAITTDGSLAVSAGLDGVLKVWDLENGRELHTLHGHTHTVLSVVVTPNGQYALSASLDGTLRVWSMQDGRECQVIDDAGYSFHIAMAANGRSLITAALWESKLRVWDITLPSSAGASALLAYGGLIGLDQVTGEAVDVAIGADGRTIVAADGAGRLYGLYRTFPAISHGC